MFEPEITRLAIAIREAVTQRRKANTIATRKRVRVRRRDLNLNYRDNVNFAYFEPERSEIEFWERRDQEHFQNSFLGDYNEFMVLADAVGSQAFLLHDFVRTVSLASFQGLDDQELGAKASALACELDNKPLPVKVIAFIDGISIDESTLR